METIFFQIGFSGLVDRKNGVIRDVSVCTAGVEARGHDMETDLQTLEDMMACGNAKGRVKTKVNHRSGADAICGGLTNFRIRGDKLKADWELLKSHDKFEHIMDLAEKMPEAIGLSAAFKGKPEVVGGKKKARCKDLLSVDFVDEAAANPDGLFAAVDSSRNGMAEPSNNEGGELGEIKALLVEMKERTDRLEQFVEDMQQSMVEDDDEDIDDDEDGDEGDEGDADEDAGDGGEGAGDQGGGELSVGRLRTAQDVVRYFEQREAKARNVDEEERIVHAFSILEAKAAEVVEFAEQLRDENENLREHIQMLESGGGQTRGGASHEPVTRFSENSPHEYERAVAALTADGKMKKTDAIRKVNREEPHLFRAYMTERGIYRL